MGEFKFSFWLFFLTFAIFYMFLPAFLSILLISLLAFCPWITETAVETIKDIIPIISECSFCHSKWFLYLALPAKIKWFIFTLLYMLMKTLIPIRVSIQISINWRRVCFATDSAPVSIADEKEDIAALACTGNQRLLVLDFSL